MSWMQEQAEAKLAAYRREADLRRQLPEGLWRAHAAQVLRNVAERLEPVPAPSAP